MIPNSFLNSFRILHPEYFFMKRMIGITSAVLILASCSSGKVASDKVPSVIVNAVNQKFPEASNIDWEKNGMVYEAEFIEQLSELTVELDASGQILRVKQDIPVNSLPTVVSGMLASRYKEFTIDDVEKIEWNKQVLYQVELNGKGRTEKHLVFMENGIQQCG